MKYKKAGNACIILLEKGDRIIESLTKFCEKEKIKSGHFSGIGGAERAEIAYYDSKDRKYHSRIFDRPPYEILNISGNVSLAGEKIKIHAHITLGNSEFRVHGGHLNEAKVFPMCEIIFTPLKTGLKRKKDEETGLFMLDMGS